MSEEHFARKIFTFKEPQEGARGPDRRLGPDPGYAFQGVKISCVPELRTDLLFRFSLRSSAAAVFDDQAILICCPFEESDVCFIYDPSRRYIARKRERLMNAGISPNTLFNWKGKAYLCGIQRWESFIRFSVLSELYGDWDRWEKYLNPAVNTTSNTWLDSLVDNFESDSIRPFYGRDPQPVPDELGINFIISFADFNSDDNREVILVVFRYCSD